LYSEASPEIESGGAQDTVPIASAVNPVVIPCNSEDVLVDCSSGCVQSNVGDTRLNVGDKIMDIGSNSDRTRQQAEDVLGKLFVVPPGLPPPTPWRVLKAETLSSASSEGMLPGISNSNAGNVRKVYTAELVANTLHLVAVPDRTKNARNVCRAILAGTGSITDRMDLKRPQDQILCKPPCVAPKMCSQDWPSY
jgi:hypothetical protein